MSYLYRVKSHCDPTLATRVQHNTRPLMYSTGDGAAWCCSQVQEYKVNTEDVFKRAKKGVQDLQEEVQTLRMQREEVSTCCTYSG